MFCIKSIFILHRYYLKAQKVLHQYEHMPSFHGIQKDCDVLVNQLKVKLREQFKSKDVSLIFFYI